MCGARCHDAAAVLVDVEKPEDDRECRENLILTRKFPKGQMVLAMKKGEKQCNGDLVLPLFPGEILWSNSFRAVVYMLALIYFFFGIAIIADIFMAAIEQITSKAKRVAIPQDDGSVVESEVQVWNATARQKNLYLRKHFFFCRSEREAICIVRTAYGPRIVPDRSFPR